MLGTVVKIKLVALACPSVSERAWKPVSSILNLALASPALVART